MRCATHPQVETYIQCTECDAAICSDCMVAGPAGFRCPRCARPAQKAKTPRFGKVPLVEGASMLASNPLNTARGVAYGAGAAVLLGWLLIVPIPLVLKLLVSLGLGALIGHLVARGSSGKAGRLLQTAAGGCAALPALIWTVPWIKIFLTGGVALIGYLLSPFGLLLTLGFALLAVIGALLRVRYL